jgi:protocatechuate 3,4-dioxygenase beta subunit
MTRRNGDATGAGMSRRIFTGAGLATAGVLWTSGARALADRPATAESPMGPFYPTIHPADADADLTWVKGRSARAAGQVIEVSGRVFDLRGNPIPDATLELWQANAAGRYDHPSDISKAPLDPNFQGYAALRTDAQGAWRIVTIKPGGYDSPIGHRTPHIHFDVRGPKSRNIAQLYFPEDAATNAADTLYKGLGADAPTSVAVRNAGDPNKYVWDIVMLG